MTTKRTPQTLWKIFFASLLALTLTGCLPVPIFEVTPSTARAGTELTFDASGSVVATVPKAMSPSGGPGSSATARPPRAKP